VCGVVVAVALVAASAYAGMGSNPSNKVALHVKSHPTSCAEGYPVFLDCLSIQTTYPGCGDVDVMPVFYDLVEFTAVEFGLAWLHDPSASMLWTRCKGDAAVGTIVHSGDGTMITWTACQVAYSIAPGFGWLTVGGPEFIRLDNYPVTHRCGVTDCQAPPGPYFDCSGVSGAGVCGLVGDDPCRPVDPSETVPTTWGAIKALVR
jgi:hypothetical protein